jgi:hypothetical protein
MIWNMYKVALATIPKEKPFWTSERITSTALIASLVWFLLLCGHSIYRGLYLLAMYQGLFVVAYFVFIRYRSVMLKITAELRGFLDLMTSANTDLIEATKIIQQQNYQRFFNDTMATEFLVWSITHYIPIQEGTGAWLDRSDPTRDPLSANQLLIIFKATKICESTSPDA